MSTKKQIELEELFKAFGELIQEKRDDIETGLEEGIYDDKKGNEAILKHLTSLDERIKNFLQNPPTVFLYIEGGVLHGASANCEIEVQLFDKDNWSQADEQDQEDLDYNPDTWDKMIKDRTAAGELIEVL
jgi:hypothetical protein